MRTARRARTLFLPVATGLLALFASTLGAGPALAEGADFARAADLAQAAGSAHATDAAASVADAIAAAAALADDPPSAHETFVSDQITIEAFYCDAAEPTQTYTVPDGVTSVYIEAVGGQGQTPNPEHTGLGGLGGQVTGGLSVTPKQEYTVQVGCGGSGDGGASAYAPGGARGTGWAHLNWSYTVYSYGYDGGGGGGASAVLAGSEEVAVAGGGGGAAGSASNCIESGGSTGGPFFFYCGGNSVYQGGNGGDGGGDNVTGSVGVNNSQPATADGSTCSADGSNNPVNAGGKGSDFDELGAGGAGGGGGGGYGGGCGGAGGQAAVLDPTHFGTVEGSAGNGGGGGQSYAAGSMNNSSIDLADDAGDGYVLFLTSADGVRTTHFGFSEHAETFCVPDGVNEIFVDALGGAGAGGGDEYEGVNTGGSGSGVQAVVPVTERTQLEITVGQYGWSHGGYGDGHGGDRGDGGAATVNDGAGGGGSTAVKQSSTLCGDQPLADLEYLVVAGGGGGGGGDAAGPAGGRGGDGGNPGEQGENGDDPDGGAAGCGGVAPGGGCQDNIHGGNGTSAGDGGGGGGGGGGYNGGGKGHAPENGEVGGGGGGGGGASYVTPTSPQAAHYYLGAPGDYNNRDGLNDGKVDLIVPVPTHRSQIQIVSGNKQSVKPGHLLGEQVVLKYVDALSTGKVDGIAIDLSFIAPAGPAATFADGDTTTKRVITDDQGLASFDLRSLQSRPPGQFAVQASVADDTQHLIKSSQVTVFSTQFTTDIALTSSAINTTDGEAVSFTATMTTPENGGGPVDSGTVQFSIDGTPFGTPVGVDDQLGTAESNAISTLAPGPHHVLATYTDVENGAQAPTFASLGQTVATDAATSVSLATSNPDALGGERAVFTATVTPEKDLGHPTGTVQFAVNGVNAGSPVPVGADGTAASEPTVLTIESGAHGGRQPFQITADYSGDDNYASSTGTMTQYVRWNTTLYLVSSAPWGVYSDTTLTFTGTVGGVWYPWFYPKHTGTLQVFLGDEPLTDPFPIDDKSGTTAPIEASKLGIGIHEITMRYSGDENYGPTTSATYYQAVLYFGERPPGETGPPTGPPMPPVSQPGGSDGAAGSGPGLAKTGTDAAGAPLAGGILLAGGGLLLWAEARRRRARRV